MSSSLPAHGEAGMAVMLHTQAEASELLPGVRGCLYTQLFSIATPSPGGRDDLSQPPPSWFACPRLMARESRGHGLEGQSLPDHSAPLKEKAHGDC